MECGIESDVVSILHDHILAIGSKEGKVKLDLFLYSRGGESDVPWSIVSMFREYSSEGSFSVLIPYRAHSAATVISLGADEIVMTKKAELGPIDITIMSGPYNPVEEGTHQRLPISVEDVTGYFSLLEKMGCERPEEKMRGFEQLTQQVHPLALGNVSRLLQQTELVALRLLGTRAKPFPEEKNRQIVKRLSSEIYSHNHTISRTEAIGQLELEQVIKAEDAKIEGELWELYLDYKDLFKFDVSFKPEEYLIVNDIDEYKWTDLKLAGIESNARFDIYHTDIRFKRLRSIPPQVALNLNITPPSIQIDNLPQGIQSQQINQLVQQLLSKALSPEVLQPLMNQAAETAVKTFLNALPIANFERVFLDTGWRLE